MKVLFLDETLVIKLVPRVYPLISDTLVLKLRNESTNEVLTPAFTFTVTDTLNITITTQPTDFIDKNKYEIEVTKGTQTLYLGKLIVVESGTDIQNYTYGNSRYQFRE